MVRSGWKPRSSRTRTIECSLPPAPQSAAHARECAHERLAVCERARFCISVLRFSTQLCACLRGGVRVRV